MLGDAATLARQTSTDNYVLLRVVRIIFLGARPLLLE